MYLYNHVYSIIDFTKIGLQPIPVGTNNSDDDFYFKLSLLLIIYRNVNFYTNIK